MSFGRPGNASLSFAASAPERGSFPLDHEGECKEYMMRYLACMKEAKSTSTPCRPLSKQYLQCRMEKGLMERANWEDLGFQEEGAGKDTKRSNHGPPMTTTGTEESSQTGQRQV